MTLTVSTKPDSDLIPQFQTTENAAPSRRDCCLQNKINLGPELVLADTAQWPIKIPITTQLDKNTTTTQMVVMSL